MSKGLAAFGNQLGRRLAYAATNGSVFSSSASLDPGDPAPEPGGTNLVTDDGTLLVTDDGTELITS